MPLRIFNCGKNCFSKMFTMFVLIYECSSVFLSLFGLFFFKPVTPFYSSHSFFYPSLSPWCLVETWVRLPISWCKKSNKRLCGLCGFLSPPAKERLFFFKKKERTKEKETQSSGGPLSPQHNQTNSCPSVTKQAWCWEVWVGFRCLWGISVGTWAKPVTQSVGAVASQLKGHHDHHRLLYQNKEGLYVMPQHLEQVPTGPFFISWKMERDENTIVLLV